MKAKTIFLACLYLAIGLSFIPILLVARQDPKSLKGILLFILALACATFGVGQLIELNRKIENAKTQDSLQQKE